MTIGESISVFGNWFQIRFIENPGMAFGLDIPGKWGKPVLTIFRIIAVIAIGWYLHQLISKKAQNGPDSLRGADFGRCHGQYYRQCVLRSDFQ